MRNDKDILSRILGYCKRRGISCLKKTKRQCQLCRLYYKHRGDCLDLSYRQYENQYDKFRRFLFQYGDDDNLWTTISQFYCTDFKYCCGDREIEIDPEEPILVVPTKNELERIKLLYSHYQNLGVKYFVIIDNESSDGTYEWVCDQINTIVFRAKEGYSTRKRDAWILRALATMGSNRWYIVVDSDELLDYIGSESHSIQECVRYAKEHHFTRLFGIMIDMYSDKHMFSEECSSENIKESLCYFDSDSYIQNPRASKHSVHAGVYFTGGPRYRVLHSKNQLSKQSLFYYSDETLYIDSHFLYPIIDWNKECSCFAIKHYKFLKIDTEKYRERAQNGSFTHNSKYYKDMFDGNGTPQMKGFVYEGSVRYINSESLRCLTYITEIDWENHQKV